MAVYKTGKSSFKLIYTQPTTFIKKVLKTN